MEIAVHRAGMLTTVQDAGRFGHRAAGVPVSGAVDAFAGRVANLLVGNPEHAAVLEFTLVGPELEFGADALIALTGADFGGDVGLWQPLRVTAGAVLRLAAARQGCRGYLAVAGGFDVPPVLGSRSTFLRGGFGGLNGRALRDGDRLTVPDVPRSVTGHWRIDPRVVPPYSESPQVRMVRGADGAEFDDTIYGAAYRVAPQSDRMGLRLQGPLLSRVNGAELPSAPVTPGTVQVPPDGQPIVLLADAQTIGGYPQLGHVVTADLPLVAQLRPGDTVRFQSVTLAAAREATLARERALAMLRQGLAGKIG